MGQSSCSCLPFEVNPFLSTSSWSHDRLGRHLESPPQPHPTPTQHHPIAKNQWVWLKITLEGLRRCWSMFPLTRVPFWCRLLEPQPNPETSTKHRLHRLVVLLPGLAVLGLHALQHLHLLPHLCRLRLGDRGIGAKRPWIRSNWRASHWIAGHSGLIQPLQGLQGCGVTQGLSNYFCDTKESPP